MKILGRKVAIDRDFREIFISEIISISGGLLAGMFLLNLLNKQHLLSGLFILLPGFLEMHGNIFGSLAARLGTLLHTKHIKPIFKFNKILTINIWATILLMFIVSSFLGIVAYFLNLYIFNTNTPVLILLTFIAAVIALLIEIPLTIATTFWFFKKGYDPDDIMGPYVTTTGDVISIVSILIGVLFIA